MNTGAIDKIYNYLSREKDYVDLSETEEARKKVKEYVPEDKFDDVVDKLCDCLDETKYAVFEQGFLRGIAAEKGGSI